MSDYPTIRERIVGYFLTEYPSSGSPGYVEDIAKAFLSRTYTEEYVEVYWRNQGESLQDDLVEERNLRLSCGMPCPYGYLDIDAQRVYPESPGEPPHSVFQEALLALSASEFERLACYLLAVVGCTSFWSTPASHDQGIDGFGFMCLSHIRDVTSEAKRVVVWVIVQAKHYEACGLSSADIVALVGAQELSRFKVYATKMQRYSQLDLLPLSPIAIILVTSGRVKRTAHLLASRSGVVLVSSDELRETLSSFWVASGMAAPTTAEGLVETLRNLAASVPTCK